MPQSFMSEHPFCLFLLITRFLSGKNPVHKRIIRGRIRLEFVRDRQKIHVFLYLKCPAGMQIYHVRADLIKMENTSEYP